MRGRGGRVRFRGAVLGLCFGCSGLGSLGTVLKWEVGYGRTVGRDADHGHVSGDIGDHVADRKRRYTQLRVGFRCLETFFISFVERLETGNKTKADSSSPSLYTKQRTPSPQSPPTPPCPLLSPHFSL